jgi:hypothetical protein
MMFYVFEKDKDLKVRRTVYNIQYKNGYPFFIIYQNGKWIIRSAKYYVPIILDAKDSLEK